ncbi:pilus assembly protein [Pseudomonas sp. CrR25]|nr:pilus assembly protein [Pseudomonas sp. CrR25]
MKRMHGQTLVELMACLLIGSIMLTSAVPAFTSTLQRNRQTQNVNQLLGALHYARGSAVMGRKTIAVCSGDLLCSPDKVWHRQLLVFDDRNENGQLDTGEELLRQIYVTQGYSWRWSNFRSRSYLQFEADGTTPALNGTFTLCHENLPAQQIVINLTGRARTQAAPSNARCN